MKIWLIGFILLQMTACSLLTTPKPEAARHDFGSITTAISKPADITVTTADWLNNDCIHYRLLYVSATELACYSLDKWIATPTDLLKQRWLHSLTSKYRLTLELSALEQQFTSRNHAQVVLQLIVHAYNGSTTQAVASQTFQFQQASAPNATGAVTGFANLVQQATDKIQRWLIELEH